MDQTGSSKKLPAAGTPGSPARAPATPIQIGSSIQPVLHIEKTAAHIDGNDRVVLGNAAPNPNGQTVISSPPPPLVDQTSLHPIELAKTLRGETLDHFILEDFVGVGGMGTVFRARDTMLNRTVAVKVLSGDQARDGETRKRFRNEAQSAARLDHENIARVFYIGEARDLPYIVFEFIEGVNLRDLVGRRKTIPLSDAVSYTLQIAGALAHASSRDVVHRDVKPSNILITPEGRAKLVDMGLARLHALDPNQADLTASGVTLGTFDYISPEQARNPRNVDVRSDIYSLGCTLYYMLAGRPPFPEGTMLQKLLQHQGEAPPDPSDINPDVPPEATRIVQKMMAKDPQQRYQSPTELISDLMLLGGNLGLRSAGPAGLVWVAPEAIRTPWWERHLPWLAPVAALLAAVAALEFRPSADPLAGDGPRTVVADGKGSPSNVPPVTKGSGSDPVRTKGTEPTDAGSGTKTPPTKGATKTPGTGSGETPPDNGTSGKTEDPRTTPANPPGKSETTTPETAPSEVVAPLTTGFAVKHKDGVKLYATLAAAYASCRQDDQLEIELRFDGPRVERPLTLEKQVTLKAAEGRRPILSFLHDASRGREPGTHMLTVVGGPVTVIGVALEMEVPVDMSIDRWALFRTRGSRGLTLRDCSMTVRNPSGHLGASFVELAPVPGSDAVMTSRQQIPPEPISVEMINVVARGEASLLRSYDLQPVDFRAINLFVAIGKSFQLLQARGGQMAPRTESKSRLWLERVTGVLRGGLCRLDSEAGFAPLTPEITAKNCILIGEHSLDREPGREDASPLIEQVGVDSINNSRQKDRLVWSGEHVAYARFQSLWRVSPTSEEPQDMSFTAWQEFWMLNEAAPKRLDTFDWAKPLPKNDVAVTMLTPDQFQLAEDGQELGADAAKLPGLPTNGNGVAPATPAGSSGTTAPSATGSSGSNASPSDAGEGS